MKTSTTHQEGRTTMKANLKKAIMASAVFGMLAGPYLASDADAICLISCGRRNLSASTTNQTQSNSQFGLTQGHTLDTSAFQYQSGDIKVGDFGNGNIVVGPSMKVNGDVSGTAVATQSLNFGIANSSVGHTAQVAPQASGDTSTTNAASNVAASRTSIPTSQGDRDSVAVKAK